jgi:hypothetical protein
MRVVRRTAALALLSIAFSSASAQSAIPEWALDRWNVVANGRSLQLSSHVKVNSLSGDFDGDGKMDVALLVEHRSTHKIGIVFIHHDLSKPRVVAAGTHFSNGGDTFDWMDSWHVQPRTRTRHTDAVVLERESSASALVYFSGGKYRWRQLGD